MPTSSDVWVFAALWAAIAAFASTPVAAQQNAIFGSDSTRFDNPSVQTSDCLPSSLGREMSALARVKLSQAGNSILNPDLSTGESSLNIRQKPGSCVGQTITGQFLGSKRVKIGRTRFDADWDRVLNRGLGSAQIPAQLQGLQEDRNNLLINVNRWVNRSITYREDINDYWNDAGSTLKSRTGDCEDFAILKMQILAAVGIPLADMMLTLVKDTMLGSHHAVLLVRDGRTWVMLDMAKDQVVSAAGDYGYSPMISFSSNERFMHGYARSRFSS